MLTKDELAHKVLKAVKGNAEAVKTVSSALVSQDKDRIAGAISQVAGIHLSNEELEMIVRELGTNPEQAVAAFST